MNTSSIISKIEAKRKELRYSQEIFAKEIGLTKNGYQYMLKSNDLKLSLLIKIANLFKVPVGYFFDESELPGGGITQNGSINNINGSVQIQLDRKDSEIEKLRQEVDYLKKLLKEKDEIIKLLKEK